MLRSRAQDLEAQNAYRCPWCRSHNPVLMWGDASRGTDKEGKEGSFKQMCGIFPTYRDVDLRLFLDSTPSGGFSALSLPSGILVTVVLVLAAVDLTGASLVIVASKTSFRKASVRLSSRTDSELLPFLLPGLLLDLLPDLLPGLLSLSL